MSRNGYEHWDEGPQVPEPAPYDPRDGRRPRRTSRADEQWLPDSEGQDRGSRQGSHRRSGEYPAAGSADSGYGDSAYADRGYTDPGYPGGAYPGGAYPGSGYSGAEYPDAGYGEASYGDAGRAGPGRAGPGYGEPGYVAGAGYTEPGYPDAGYGDARYPASGQAGYPDSPYPDAAYPDGGRYGSSGEHGAPGYRGADYQNGYRDAGYPAGGHRDPAYGPTGPSRPGPADSFAPKAPFPAQDDPYGAPDPYGPADPYVRGTGGHTDPRGQTDPFGRTDPHGQAPRGQDAYDDDTLGRSSRSSSAYGGSDGYGGLGSYGGQASYGGPAGYDTGDPYTGGQAGYNGQDEYEEPAGTQYGGGYDEHDYGAAAGPDPRQQYPARDAGYVRRGDRDERYDRRVPVDDTGITRRRERDPEDELDADSARHNGFFRGFGAAEDEFGHRPKRRKRSRAGMFALVVLILFVGGLVGGGAYAYNWYSKRHADWAGSAGYGSVLVKVLPGEVACGSTLENTLVSDGVVASASAFCSAAKASGQSSLLQPGYFRLHKHMGAQKAWLLIINPKARVQSTVAVPDGLRASKIIAVLAAKTGIPLSQFQSALKDTAALGLPSWAKGNPEGFLWPATYPIQPGSSALSILQTMVQQFKTEIAGINLAAKAKAAQFTEYQVIIAASLLEGEVPPQYYGQVARVIDNRLNQSPPWNLGLDSTVAYAVNKYIYNLSQSDLNVNSPYNTTKHPGLPPGPIDSPDLAAMQAVLHPATGDWLYFVTINKKGTTLFTSSSAQFNTWANLAKANGV
jgi:UPF0755 protein